MATIYIDQSTMERAVGLINEQGTKVVYTGLEVTTEADGPLLAELSRLCGLDFFPNGAAPEVPLYAVPYLEVFASDGQGGWFAAARAGSDSTIYYITLDRTTHLVSEHRSAFLRLAVTNPNWRRKVLPGGPWPRLPEDPEGRKKLAETLSMPPEKEGSVPDALPRIFSSRAEAEKEFPILDVWTVMRQKTEPRFQVHPMMSPQDREGRALVHYQAWQETYSGLMPESILAAHTLERCLERANDRRSNSTNTFVALDRENGDRVVGFGTLYYHARDFVSVPEAGEVGALYVLKDFQGQGIGRDLLGRCLAWLPRPRVALFVLKGNDKAIGFYEHMGFRLTGHKITQNGMTELEMVLEKEAISAHSAP